MSEERRHLESVKLEQKERRIDFAKNFDRYPDVIFVSKAEDIKWHDKYIRFLEDKL